ncbi:addiction module antidote protein, HigA family [Burkholderia sp. D7]|nr:addiction module antidote protein, HigA family [Burkholderia sp. D7]
MEKKRLEADPVESGRNMQAGARVRLKNGMRPIHPGEILREDFLAPLGMSANALAQRLNVPTSRMNDIVRERRGVTPDTAMRLARFFGGDATSWLNLQQAHDLKIAERAHGPSIDAEVTPRKMLGA